MARMQVKQGFAEEVLAEAGDADLRACFSCGTCTAACPISWMDEDYNPRRILKLLNLGARHEVLSSPAIWLCSACEICYGRCPQHIHLSDLMKAIRNVAIREGYEPARSPAFANKRACASCGMCVETCPYDAIELAPIWVDGRRQMVAPKVNAFLCQECGICTATCPVSAISVPSMDDLAILAQIRELGSGNGYRGQTSATRTPKIMAFVCDWCLYSKLDRASIAQVQAQPDVQIVRIPCLGRMDPLYALTALQEGFDGVLVVGCTLGNCHYQHGNFMAENRRAVLKAVIEAAGESGRVKFVHVSTDEKGVLSRLVDEMRAQLVALGPIGSRSLLPRHQRSFEHSIDAAQSVG